MYFAPVVIPALTRHSFLQRLRTEFHTDLPIWSYLNTVGEGKDPNVVLADGLEIFDHGNLTVDVWDREAVNNTEGVANRMGWESHAKYIPLFETVLYMAEERTGIPVEYVQRHKVNAYLPNLSRGKDHSKVYRCHPDWIMPTIVENVQPMLSLVLNFSDEEETAPLYLYHDMYRDDKLHLEVAHTIHLAPGDAVIFGSNWWHSAACCDTLRRTLSIVFRKGGDHVRDF